MACIFKAYREDGCDKGAHHSYLGTDRNTVIPNGCYPREYLGFWTLISFKWAQILEACDCVKRLSIDLYFFKKKKKVNSVISVAKSAKWMTTRNWLESGTRQLFHWVVAFAALSCRRISCKKTISFYAFFFFTCATSTHRNDDFWRFWSKGDHVWL